MANLSYSRLSYLSFRLLCLSRIDQMLKARSLIFYILRMQKMKSSSIKSSMADFDVILDVFKKVENGDYPDFKSCAFSLKSIISEMRPFEQVDAIVNLRRHYNEFNGINQK